ncbi:YafY family protein [soil metagenome]
MISPMTGTTDRLFALVDALQGKQQTTTQVLAERFGVSERTIRRDISRLQDLDVDVEMVQGRGGGIRLKRGGLLQALRFTDDEVLVLALGLKNAQQMSDTNLNKAATSAFKRLEQVLSERLGERLEAVLKDVSTEPVQSNQEVRSVVLLDVAEAVRQRQRLEVRYQSRDQTFTYRKLDPYGVVHLKKHWYVTGYCHLRSAIRVFRLDRLEIVSGDESTGVAGTSFIIPKNFRPLEFVSASLAQAAFEGSVTCRVWLETNLEDLSRQVPDYTATIEVQDGGVLMTFLAHPDWFSQITLYLLGIPVKMRVLEPVKLQHAFVALAERATTAASDT